MKRTAVLNLVGLTSRLIGPSTPRLAAFQKKHGHAKVDPVLPAVTCSAQSTYLTGLPPSGHGIVGNGWYDRTLSEVQFWKQSNHLVHGQKLWEELKKVDSSFTCAKLFWWYNMYSTADYSITPRPMYPADGRKVFDVYSWPYSIRSEIKQELGDFPFPGFWGPAAGVETPQGKRDSASRWIADSARWIEKKYQPGLSLVYLPHLDYNLQRWGPNDPRVQQDLKELDELAGGLIDFFQGQGVQCAVLSEYGIVPVNKAVHLNRLFREKGWLVVKEELGREILDPGASRVFAVADHQLAHLYLTDPTLSGVVRKAVESQEGVAQVLDRGEQKAWGLDHPRSGDLIALARENAWFTYYYWLDDARAPDFARCVDIHRKPGYDPVELFLDPGKKFVKGQIAWRLLKKKLGFRMLMDLIPLDATLVRGSHGVRPADQADWPLLMLEGGTNGNSLQAVDVYGALKSFVTSR